VVPLGCLQFCSRQEDGFELSGSSPNAGDNAHNAHAKEECRQPAFGSVRTGETRSALNRDVLSGMPTPRFRVREVRGWRGGRGELIDCPRRRDGGWGEPRLRSLCYGTAWTVNPLEVKVLATPPVEEVSNPLSMAFTELPTST